MLEEDAEEGGFYVTGYDGSGRATTETTWHGARSDAIEWTSREHAPADVVGWTAIPDDVSNPAAHAARRASRR